MEVDLDKLLEGMPDESAGEEEILSFVEKVLAQPGGREAIRMLASGVTGVGNGEVAVRAEQEDLPVLRSPARLIFRVELLDTKPLVWRRLSLPADCTFFHLHQAIQDAFCWKDRNGHRFEVWDEGQCEVVFGAGEGKEEEEIYCEKANQIMELFREQLSEFFYRYDSKDEWLHRVVVEDLVGEGMAGTSKDLLPCLHDGQGYGPPENCGGVTGFADFLAGNHPLSRQMEPQDLEEMRLGQPDLTEVKFRRFGEPESQ